MVSINNLPTNSNSVNIVLPPKTSILPVMDTFKKKAILSITGFIQVAFGILNIVFPAIVLFCRQHIDKLYAPVYFERLRVGYANPFVLMSLEIWSGVISIVCGCLGISAGYRPSRCKIITMMVFTVLSALTGIHFVCIKSIQIHNMNVTDDWNDKQLGQSDFNNARWILVVQLIIYLVQTSVAIPISCMTCRSFCKFYSGL